MSSVVLIHLVVLAAVNATFFRTTAELRDAVGVRRNVDGALNAATRLAVNMLMHDVAANIIIVAV